MHALTRRATLAAVALAFAHTAWAASPTPAPIEAPAGNYVLEKTHSSLHWRIRHMGLSNYTARFKRFDVTLQFDPADFSRSTVQASIDIGSLETDLTTPDFNAELRGDPFFNVAKFPRATFTSKQVTPTGPRAMRVLGDLVLLGVARPVTLDVVLNGSMKSHPFAKVPALGFSAKGAIARTAFGLNPPPVREGVGDEVELLIEAEFLKQP